MSRRDIHTFTAPLLGAAKIQEQSRCLLTLINAIQHLKIGNPVICYSIDEPGKYVLSKIEISHTQKYCMISLTWGI